jgi:thiosulfate dehydrogenase [quinone] large subunit
MEQKLKTITQEMPELSKWQWTSLIILRVLLGWHLLYEGLIKITDPNWSSAPFLNQATWIFTGFFSWIAESAALLSFVDFVNQWALCLIGAALIAGLFSRTAAISGGFLLLMYYMANPPLFSQEYIAAANEHSIIVNKLLIEACALFVIGLFPTGRIIGLDLLLQKIKDKKSK